MLFLFFIFGICLGSFATVLISRLPVGEDFVFSRSRCLECHKSLGIFELVPIVSWVVLRAKCKYCKARISPFYPLSELAVGFLAVFAFFFRTKFSPSYAFSTDFYYILCS